MQLPVWPFLALTAVQFACVCANSSCSSVDDVSSPADCMSMAVSQRRATAVVGKKACFICQPFSSQLYPSQCGGVSGCSLCVGYQFHRVANPTRQLLLLRTHKDSRVSPYTLFKTGPSNQNLLLTSPAMSDGGSYKSPLFHLAYEAGVSQVELQLLTTSGQAAVRLRFSLQGDLTSDAWFSKERLVSSWPWSLAAMKRDSYNVFSIDGFDYAKGHNRRFYISKNHGGCEKDRGYLVVSIADYCNYFKGSKPAFFWNPDANVTWSAMRYKEADVFQLMGILDPAADTQILTASVNP